MPMPECATDAELALGLATEAGVALLAARDASVDPVELGRLGDRAAQELLAARLAAYRPHDAVLSEEAEDDPTRHAARRVWIIDPLDGTREYSEPGRSDWAVHVALWAATGASGGDGSGTERAMDGTLVAGAVALPALGERIGAELVPMGSAGAKTMAVVRGEVDAYLHGGGQYEWDSAAPVAVAVAAGLHASRLDGGPLRYNRADPLLPDLFVCRPELVDVLSAGLAEVGA